MKINSKNKLFLLCGPRAVGGTHLIASLQKCYSGVFTEVRTTTTRPPRLNDPNDATRYNFVTKKSFQTLNNKKLFLETDEFNGNWYGTTRANLQEALYRSHAIMKITVKGAETIYADANTRAITQIIFLLPKNDAVLVRNLNRRSKKTLSAIKYADELASAHNYIEKMKKSRLPKFTMRLTGTELDVENFKKYFRVKNLV